MSDKICVNMDFNQVAVKIDVMEAIASHLKDDPESEESKVTLKESLALAAKGTKLKNGPANDLLYCILKAMSLVRTEAVGQEEKSEFGPDEEMEDEEENEDEGDEEENEDESDDEFMSQMLKTARQKDALAAKKKTKQAPAPNAGQGQSRDTHGNGEHKDVKNKPKNSKEVCRYYARGKCNKAKDCRFGHPNICKKFRKLGGVSTNKNGCDGKCDDFHPNACRSSLRNKTCSFFECRFFHLKGTKKINIGTQVNPISTQFQTQNNKDNYTSNNWMTNQQNNNKGRQRNDNPDRNQQQRNVKTKNWRTGPNQGDPHQDASPEEDQEKSMLSKTLEAIMGRLTAMETRHQVFYPQNTQAHLSAQHRLSPVVPQPGTQTQNQWASQNPWTQSQY